MKYGLFIHPLVEDPSNDDPSYGRLEPNGRIECSKEGHDVQAYLDNKNIIDELRKDYNMFTLKDLGYAALRLSGSDPLDDFDFLITNFPPRHMDRVTPDEYRTSFNRLKSIQKNRPNLPVIVYTGAPQSIRNKIAETGAHVIPRGRYGLEIELEEMKKIIGKSFK